MAKLKLNTQLCEGICNDIKAGVPVEHACVAHGITKVTFYNWYNKGKEAKSGKFKRFYDKVEEAKSVAITLRARRIYKAGEDNWKADAWWLERVDPDNFARKDRQKVDAKAEVVVTTPLDEASKLFMEADKKYGKEKKENIK